MLSTSCTTTTHHKTRIAVYDYLRIILCLLVVAIHADTITASPTNYLGGISWWIAAITNTFGRVAVPLFVVLSGELAFSKNSDQLDIKKIFSRFGIPILFFVPAYYLFNTLYLNQKFSFAIGHLYYLFIALGLRLITPYFIRYKQYLTNKVILSILVLTSAIDFVAFQVEILRFLSFPLLIWISYSGFYTLPLVNTRKLSYLLVGIATFLIAVFGAFTLYLGNTLISNGVSVWWQNDQGNYFTSHFAPTIVLAVYLIWNSVVSLSKKAIVNFPFLTDLSISTYGIYLIHPFVLNFMDRDLGFAIHLVTYNLTLYYLLKISLATAISYLLVKLIRTTHFGRSVLGG